MKSDWRGGIKAVDMPVKFQEQYSKAYTQSSCYKASRVIYYGTTSHYILRIIYMLHHDNWVSFFSIDQDNTYPYMVVYSNGQVIYMPPTTMKVQCSGTVDGNYDCNIKLGSWTYDGSKISLETSVGLLDTSNFQPHPRWNLTSASAEINVMQYDCCPEPYHDYQMNITITDLF